MPTNSSPPNGKTSPAPSGGGRRCRIRRGPAGVSRWGGSAAWSGWGTAEPEADNSQGLVVGLVRLLDTPGDEGQQGASAGRGHSACHGGGGGQARGRPRDDDPAQPCHGIRLGVPERSTAIPAAVQKVADHPLQLRHPRLLAPCVGGRTANAAPATSALRDPSSPLRSHDPRRDDRPHVPQTHP